MPQRAASEPITIRTDKVAAIDALASAMERSRNYVVASERTTLRTTFRET